MTTKVPNCIYKPYLLSIKIVAESDKWIERYLYTEVNHEVKFSAVCLGIEVL